MRNAQLTISNTTQRRFILGKQGLYPGRRWQGQAGAAAAINADCVVQIDPLAVVARSHDIALYGRVLDYQPAHLDALLHTARQCFDYGGTVMIYPMCELPYWRVVMARKQNQPRWTTYAAEHQPVIETVRTAVTEQGPLAARDLAGKSLTQTTYRSGKDTGQALYYLWLAGELMTHSRRGFDRVYDLRSRIAPSHLDYAAAPDEADDYFAHKTVRQLGMVTERGWRNWLAGTIERPVDKPEAAARFDALLAAGTIVPIALDSDAKTPRYVLAEDFPLLEALHAGKLPDSWQPLDTTNANEMICLAPLEIVSTRGRALPLFGFEYLWEVYKPQAKRRWGYYTLPILYGDKLVARFDSKLERSARTLVIKGFWLEADTQVGDSFASALIAGFRRFMRFVGADRLELTPVVPADVRDRLQVLQ
ncbi:MAG: YcaQ family DNA glycosylase [Anaerolineae bacterium]|nr:YcaQ family DNA glycosylase [Anaerolineae bacterium]